MLEYEITAVVTDGGEAKAIANETTISFDATSGRDEVLPNPAELILTSLAACMLKNVQRYAEILHFSYRKARITIHGTRNDNPPFMASIRYRLEVDTDLEERKIEMWHKNILKFGTVTNTLAKSCELTGEMIKWEYPTMQ
ncbi:MAG: OsmC family protein [Microbacter sp.]